MKYSGRIDQKIDFSVILSNFFGRCFDFVGFRDVDFENVDVWQRRQLRRSVGMSTRRDHFVIGSTGQNLCKLETKRISLGSYSQPTCRVCPRLLPSVPRDCKIMNYNEFFFFPLFDIKYASSVCRGNCFFWIKCAAIKFCRRCATR